MSKLLGCILFTLSINCFANNQLVLSSQTTVNYLEPNIISHGGNLLILKYDDWHFSHEVINPLLIYPSVDLTGLEADFIRSLFDEPTRNSLPKWLAELSIEQADFFGITNNKTEYKKLNQIEYYSVYDPNNDRGNIFILEAHQVHHLRFSGKKNKYIDLINAIKER